MLTINQVADRLGVSRATVLRRINEGRLKANRTGRNYRVSPEALQAYVEADPIPPGSLTLQEVADRLSLSRATVTRRIRAGELHAIKLGHRA